MILKSINQLRASNQSEHIISIHIKWFKNICNFILSTIVVCFFVCFGITVVIHILILIICSAFIVTSWQHYQAMQLNQNHSEASVINLSRVFSCHSSAMCVSDEELDWVGAAEYDQTEINTAVDLLLHFPLTELNLQSEPDFWMGFTSIFVLVCYYIINT